MALKENSAEGIYKHIAALLQKYDSMTPMEGYKGEESPSGHFDDLGEEIVFELDKLFLQSHKEGFFWYDCPLTVYISTLHDRLRYYREYVNPSLDLENLMLHDYKIFDIIPLYGQRILRTDRKELNQYTSLDYDRLLKKDYAVEVREKFEQDREKKMEYIQMQFQKQGKQILKSGYEFKIKALPAIERVVEVAPAHSHIFANNGFKLFQYLLENSIVPHRGRKSDIAYFYWRMYEADEKFIIARPTPFREWFLSEFGEDLGDKLKTLNEVKNLTREREYLRAVNWLKKQ